MRNKLVSVHFTIEALIGTLPLTEDECIVIFFSVLIA